MQQEPLFFLAIHGKFPGYFNFLQRCTALSSSVKNTKLTYHAHTFCTYLKKKIELSTGKVKIFLSSVQCLNKETEKKTSGLCSAKLPSMLLEKGPNTTNSHLSCEWTVITPWISPEDHRAWQRAVSMRHLKSKLLMIYIDFVFPTFQTYTQEQFHSKDFQSEQPNLESTPGRQL